MARQIKTTSLRKGDSEMFAASSQYANRGGINYSGDSQSQPATKAFRPPARSVNIPMNSSLSMSAGGFSDQSSDRDGYSMSGSNMFSNQQPYLGMNMPSMPQLSSAQRDQSFGGQNTSQYQNGSQMAYMEKTSLARGTAAMDTKNKVDGKVRSERFMKELQSIISSQLENIKGGIIKDLKCYKEVDESVKRSMGLSVDSLSETIELLKNDIKTAVKNYSRKVEESMNEQQSGIEEISKQFSTRVKTIFPGNKNSKKKSADELEDEINSTIQCLSGEISTLQRELEAIRSQIQIDGEFIKERLEEISMKEHEGFKMAAKGQEAVQKQILETIRVCQIQAQSLPKPTEGSSKIDPNWESALLAKADKQLQVALKQYSKKTLTLEKEIEKLKQNESLLEKELKAVRETSLKTEKALLKQNTKKVMQEGPNEESPVLMKSSKPQILRTPSISKNLQQNTPGSSAEKKLFGGGEGTDSIPGSQTKKLHWKTARKLEQEAAQLKQLMSKKQEENNSVALRELTRQKIRIEADLALQELRAKNSRWDFLRDSEDECGESGSETQSEDEKSQQSKSGTANKGVEPNSSKTSGKQSVKNPYQEERSKTKQKVKAIAGSELAEAMDTQATIIEKANRSVKRLRVIANKM